jgi:hypothetical protein
MSDQQGLSIFDQRRSGEPPQPGAASSASAFPVVRKGGYDRDAVDARMRELATAEQVAEQTRARVVELQQQVTAL